MKTRLLLSLSAALCLQPHFAFAAAGNSAGQVLKLGAGARQAALGDTGTTDAGDSLAVFWNPAGLGLADRCSVAAGHSRLVDSSGYSSLSAACPTRYGVFAAGWQYLSYGTLDSLDNTGAVDGEFSPSERVVSAAWGLASADKTLLAGAAVKQVSVTIDASASALAADLGVIKRFSVFSLGAALKNAGQQVEFNRVSENLPRTLKAGARADLERVSLMLDTNSAKDGAWLSGGAEFWLSRGGEDAPVALRAGYTTRAKAGGLNFSLGCGITENAWGLDYAFVSSGDLGATHHFTLSYLFDKPGAGKKKSGPRARPFDGRPGPATDKLILLPAENFR